MRFACTYCGCSDLTGEQSNPGMWGYKRTFDCGGYLDVSYNEDHGGDSEDFYNIDNCKSYNLSLSRSSKIDSLLNPN